MTDIHPVAILVGTIFLWSVLLLNLSAAASNATAAAAAAAAALGKVDENVEPQTSLNGYYVDSLNEIASGVGYVYKIHR